MVRVRGGGLGEEKHASQNTEKLGRGALKQNQKKTTGERRGPEKVTKKYREPR